GRWLPPGSMLPLAWRCVVNIGSATPFNMNPTMATIHPRVSVIVPSFNQGKFLRETLASVVTQAYERLEVIVLDGGSTDSSVDIIREFESHIAFWRSAPDGG